MAQMNNTGARYVVQAVKPTECFARERELLVLCSRKTIDQAVKQFIENCVAQDVDWEHFLQLSVVHKTYPLVYSTLETICSDSVPVDVMACLGSWCVRNAARNMALCKTLVMVLDLLGKNNIRVLPFKGPILAENVYGDISLRVFSDLDLLVSKKDAFKARNLLAAEGFIPDLHLHESQAGDFLKRENFFRLASSDGLTVIDLHWEMSGRYSLIPLYLEDLEKHIIVQHMFGRKVRTLRPEALLVYLSLHHASHGWDNLDAATCMVEIIRSEFVLDGETMIALARRYHALRTLLTALHVLKMLYQVRLPEVVCAAIEQDNRVVRIANGIISNLMDVDDTRSKKTWSWRFSMEHLVIRDNTADAMLYACRLFFLPTVKEWMVFPLSPLFTHLYYGLRPLRLAVEALRGALMRFSR